ncbi:putative reverse transcriptase domain-containing protein, partial [Tanacetum coccineum]
PSSGNVRTLIMDETHAIKYYVHPGADKMYYNLRDLYWWLGKKKDIAMYVSKCLTCLKAIHKDYKMDKLARIYINKLVARHGVLTDGQSKRAIQTLEDMLKACVIDFDGS